MSNSTNENVPRERVDVAYTDVDQIREALVGRKIVRIDQTTRSRVYQQTIGELTAEADERYQAEVDAWHASYDPENPEPMPVRQTLNTWDLRYGPNAVMKSELFDASGTPTYDEAIRYELDNGHVLWALANDGGCACSNGCFTVAIEAEVRDKLIGATILGVHLQEVSGTYRSAVGEYVEQEIEPGSIGDGSSTIRLFVYTELNEDRAVLVESEGGDNGYYGWGFNLVIERPVMVLREVKTQPKGLEA